MSSFFDNIQYPKTSHLQTYVCQRYLNLYYKVQKKMVLSCNLYDFFTQEIISLILLLSNNKTDSLLHAMQQYNI